MIYLLITGSRTFTGVHLMKRVLDEFINDHWDEEIVLIEGGAKGADQLAKDYCRDKGLPCFEFPANWYEEGRAAGVIRNARMVGTWATHAIAFWDGRSPGTQNAINLCHKNEVELLVVKF